MYTHTYVTFFEQKIGDKETRKRRRRRTIKLQRMNKKCWTIKACGSADRFSPQRSDKFPRIPFTTTPSYQKFLHFTVSARHWQLWHVQGLADITTRRMEGTDSPIGRIETAAYKNAVAFPSNDSFDFEEFSFEEFWINLEKKTKKRSFDWKDQR